ncbi:hypothetical protein E4U09_002979 [Claviceps aff. purpurea]|uniref:Uncharacterized protein n=1 Tax=Claviceps aff. purpurea TaxID=1967640 RepID=A0A9P7TYA0_9HYPO|nr:hypothetical protein E4U09_002979 [Claviceps aff. purpurea]
MLVVGYRLSSHENAENDHEAALGADAELQRARPRPRRRVLEYVPRRRNNAELREVVEGEDCGLTDLWEPRSGERDQLPPPEVMYDSFDAAVAGVTAWAKEHGVAYRKQTWTNKHHHRLLMVCFHAGEHPERADVHDGSRLRPGATSQKLTVR